MHENMARKQGKANISDEPLQVLNDDNNSKATLIPDHSNCEIIQDHEQSIAQQVYVYTVLYDIFIKYPFYWKKL